MKKNAKKHKVTKKEIQDRSELLDIFAVMLRPNPRILISDYSDGHIYIPPPASRPGTYRLSLTPYAREIMDECSPMSPAREIIMVAGTQTTKTQIILNGIAYYIENDPTSMLVGFPNEKEGKQFVRTRIDPMVDYNKFLKDLIGVRRKGSSGNTTDFKEFPGGFLKRASGEAANSFKSTMCRIVWLDEYDGFPPNIEGQGSGKTLAEQRTATYRGREKIVVSSTPTNENSQVLALLENTDKRHYFLTSPNGELFELEWKGFHWRAEDTNVKEVWYEIPETGERIEEYLLPELLASGRWIPTNMKKTDPTKIGFWISGLYSPFRSWRDTVGTYLEAQVKEEKGDFSDITSFYNNILALPYEANTTRPDASKMMLWAKNKDYAYKRYTNAGSFPKDVLFLTSGTDVQKDRLETEIKGWCRGGVSRSIEHYVFPVESGKTTLDLSANCWQEYKNKVLNLRYLREDGLELGVAFNGIDRSYNPEAVQAFCESVDSTCERVIPLRGVDNLTAAISDIKTGRMKHPNGEEKTIMYRNVGVSRLKGEAYHNFRLPYNEGHQGVCMFPEDYEPEYFDQLTAEEYKAGKNGKKGKWETIRNRNEALDIHNYNMAMWYYSGATGWTDEDYRLHEEKLANLVKGISAKKIAAKRYVGRQTFKTDLGI